MLETYCLSSFFVLKTDFVISPNYFTKRFQQKINFKIDEIYSFQANAQISFVGTFPNDLIIFWMTAGQTQRFWVHPLGKGFKNDYVK